MRNSKFFTAVIMAGVLMAHVAHADDEFVDVVEDVVVTSDDVAEQSAADAIAAYDADGSLFQQITDLEQEKVLMQLEKERAQLDLELDRLAAEKIKLHMEIDTLSGRAEAQQQEIETEKARLEAEAQRIERERESLAAEKSAPAPSVAASSDDAAPGVSAIGEKYRLVNVIGAGSQLQATIADINTGQTKRIRVGGKLDGYDVRSISLDDGVTFVHDGTVETLNIGGGR